MYQEYIEIRGARENNLKNVSLRIPKRKITIFTGVSGSGKSSIVFDTIGTEAQRLLNENFQHVRPQLFAQIYPARRRCHRKPESWRSLWIRSGMGGGSHSTMGTITDIYTILRLHVFAHRAAICRILLCLFLQRSPGYVSRMQWHWPKREVDHG